MDKFDLEVSEKHVKHAWMAAAFSAGVTFFAAMIGIFNESVSGGFGYDEWNLLDVLIIGGLGYGVYRKSRISAICLILYFILNIIVEISIEGGNGLSGILFGYFYIRGGIAIFAIHKNQSNTDDGVEKKPLSFFQFMGFCVVGIAVIGFSVLAYFGVSSPEIEVLSERRIDEEYINYTTEIGALNDDEDIIYWYSDGLSSFKESFYFITQNKVVLFNEFWGEDLIIVPYSDIVEMEFERNESFLEDSYATIYLNDDYWVFPLSSEKDGDIKFYDKMYDFWQEAKPDSLGE